MIAIDHFEPQLAELLPATFAVLSQTNLKVHPLVKSIILHGSRGVAGGFRPDSDIDLSLLVDVHAIPIGPELITLLQNVLDVTQSNWQGAIAPDLAVVFDVRQCGLDCFDGTAWDGKCLAEGGVDCFGLFKVQMGFSGLVDITGVQVKRMYPCIRIWQNAQT